MSKPFVLPDLSSPATIVLWLVAAGDEVTAGQPALLVLTETQELLLPAPATGTLEALASAAGDHVQPGATLAQLKTSRPALADADRRRATPVARTIATRQGVDLTGLVGSGVGGTVVKRDVLDSLSPQSRAPDAGFCIAEQIGNNLPELSGPAAHGGSRIPPAPPADSADPRRSTLVPLTAMRRAIAEHMLRSKATSPHATSAIEADLSAVVALRTRLRESYQRRGVDLTYTACLALATLRTLRDHPALNARWHGAELIYLARVQLGIAVATATGLVVPVVRDAAELSLQGLARAINDLAERGKAGGLRPDELSGGTFTITNPGAGVIRFGMPIIPQPQAAILGVGTIEKRVVVREEQGVDGVVIRPLVTLTLAYDARLVDAGAADRFLGDLQRQLEQLHEG